jgi:hypothetical protein
MKSLFVRTISRVLILCMSAVSFQASAEMIGTGEVAAAVAKSSPGTRADRVAALTDAEVAGLTGRLADLPAGAIDGIVIGIAAVVIFLIWRFGIRDQQAAASKEPAKK